MEKIANCALSLTRYNKVYADMTTITMIIIKNITIKNNDIIIIRMIKCATIMFVIIILMILKGNLLSTPIKWKLK